jgi:hypothetical protein
MVLDLRDSEWESAAAALAEWSRTQSEQTSWAFEDATTLAFEERWDDLWWLTLRALDLIAFEERAAIAVLAAGSLENLVRYAADVVEERIVAEIRRDPKFRRAMTGVWARKERADFWSRITPLLSEYPTDPID